jgi:uncharacterized protein (DUF433 family)
MGQVKSLRSSQNERLEVTLMPRRSGGSSGKALGRPPGPGTGLTPELIRQMSAAGASYTEIAETHGVTKQAVSNQALRHGAPARTNVRDDVMANYPWTVPASMYHADPNKRMRDHAEYVATGGEGMSERKLYRLRLFYKRLERENLVVEFDPSIPPGKGISEGGFAYRPRCDSDGDLIIRVNEHTNLTDEGRRLWKMPPIRP